MKKTMEMVVHWAEWSRWKSYFDDMGRKYKSRTRDLYCGRYKLARLVHTTKPGRLGFYMYGSGGAETIEGASALGVTRKFLITNLAIRP